MKKIFLFFALFAIATMAMSQVKVTTVDNIGNLTYPYFYMDYFSGSFSNNEINIGYSSSGPMGLAAYENHNIRGIKINQ